MRDPEAEANARLRDFAARFTPTVHTGGVVQDTATIPDYLKPAVKEDAVPNADLPSDYAVITQPEVYVPSPAEKIRAGDFVSLMPLVATGYRFPRGVDRVELMAEGGGKVVVDYSIIAKVEKGQPGTVGDLCQLKFASDAGPRYRLVSFSVDRQKGWFEPLDRYKGDDDIIRRLDQMVRL